MICLNAKPHIALVVHRCCVRKLVCLEMDRCYCLVGTVLELAHDLSIYWTSGKRTCWYQLSATYFVFNMLKLRSQLAYETLEIHATPLHLKMNSAYCLAPASQFSLICNIPYPPLYVCLPVLHDYQRIHSMHP